MRLLVVALVAATALLGVASAQRVVCVYDTRSLHREGQAKMLPGDVEASLSYCTHLVYGYATLNPETYKLNPLEDDNVLAITGLKKRYPTLSILLGIGGRSDSSSNDRDIFMNLLEDGDHRTTFVKSAKSTMKQFNFDGIDLAWEFPENKLKKDRGTIGSIWHSIKKTFGYAHSHKDDKAPERMEGFTALVRELKTGLREDQKLLSATIIPNINYTLYYNMKALPAHLDFLTIQVYDYFTAARSPNVADYPAALRSAEGRDEEYTVDGNVKWIVREGVDRSKIVLGIPNYGRTWKLTSESKASGAPPIEADGAGEAGPHTNTRGILSHAEICALINTNNNDKAHGLRRVSDPSHKVGPYGYRLAKEDSSEEGIWVGYEDMESVGSKAAYVKTEGLGGVSFPDISFDDFKGVCLGDRFPLIKSAKLKL